MYPSVLKPIKRSVVSPPKAKHKAAAAATGAGAGAHAVHPPRFRGPPRRRQVKRSARRPPPKRSMQPPLEPKRRGRKSGGHHKHGKHHKHHHEDLEKADSIKGLFRDKHDKHNKHHHKHHHKHHDKHHHQHQQQKQQGGVSGNQGATQQPTAPEAAAATAPELVRTESQHFAWVTLARGVVRVHGRLHLARACQPRHPSRDSVPLRVTLVLPTTGAKRELLMDESDAAATLGVAVDALPSCFATPSTKVRQQVCFALQAKAAVAVLC